MFRRSLGPRNFGLGPGFGILTTHHILYPLLCGMVQLTSVRGNVQNKGLEVQAFPTNEF